MHDILYDKQEEWSGALNSRDYFLTYATTIGLDTKKFLADYDNPSVEEKILAEFREGVKLGIQGTPTFFVNGKQLENVRDLAGFNKAIKDAAQAVK
jgi:protein-disulfide isomerase